MARLGPALAANLREAARSLVRARLRTLLGLIGIMIGIASVIGMVSIGEIATAQSRKQFEALGTDIVTVKTQDGNRGAGIALGDALALADGLRSIAAAAPVIEGSGGFTHAGKRVGSGSTQGVTASFADLNKLPLAGGRFVSDLDIGGFWCVVGAEVAAAMRRTGTLDVLGATIDIKGRFFEVVGELGETEENYGLPFQVEANRSVFIPITTAERVVENAKIELIVAR